MNQEVEVVSAIQLNKVCLQKPVTSEQFAIEGEFFLRLLIRRKLSEKLGALYYFSSELSRLSVEKLDLYFLRKGQDSFNRR